MSSLVRYPLGQTSLEVQTETGIQQVVYSALLTSHWPSGCIFIQDEETSTRTIAPDDSSAAHAFRISFFNHWLPDDHRIERVYWTTGWRNTHGTVLKVWTVITQPDERLQRTVYAAESRFLDAFPNLPVDFSILFRRERPHEHFTPRGAQRIR
jgi:hypothetical protein